MPSVLSHGAFVRVVATTNLPSGAPVVLTVNRRPVAEATVLDDGSVVFSRVKARPGRYAVRSGAQGSFVYSNKVRVRVKLFGITKLVDRPGTRPDTFRVATGAWAAGTPIVLLRNGEPVAMAVVAESGKWLPVHLTARPGRYRVSVMTDLGQVLGKGLRVRR